MKRWLFVLLCAMWFSSGPAWGQFVSGTLTTVDADDTCATTACVTLQLNPNIGSATIDLSGTFGGATVLFRVTSDGTNWRAIEGVPSDDIVTPASSATAAGVWQFNVAGYQRIRARATVSVTSITVRITAGQQSARGVGGGSGTVAIGGTVTDGTPGSILHIGTGPVLAQDNDNFFWNAGNFSLEIGDNDYSSDASDARMQISYVNTRSGLILRNVSNSNLRTHQFTTASGFGRFLMYSDTQGAGTNIDLQAGTTRTSTIPGHLTLGGVFDGSNFAAFADQDATPSVAAGNNFTTANTMATTITTFDGGFNGQRVCVKIGDSLTSVAQSGDIVLSTSGTHAFSSGEFPCFTYNGTVWTQEGTVASQLLDPTAISTISCNFSLFRSTGLADTDDLVSVSNCSYPGRAITITSVRCQSVGGTPDVMLQRNDGSAANLLTGSITCSTSTGGAAGTIATAEDNFAATDTLDFLMGTAGATTQISILITATVDSI